MLRCKDQSYYTGHTDHLEHRMAQHECGAIPTCYTLKQRPMWLGLRERLCHAPRVFELG